MAEAKKAAPAAVAAAPVPPKKNTVLYIVIALLVLVVLAILGVGAFLFLTMGQPGGDPTAGDDGTAHTPVKKPKPKPKDHDTSKPVFAKLDTFTVNLRGSSSVLQTEVYVQMADEHMKDTVTAYLPRIDSQVMLLLSGMSAEDLTTVAAKQKLMVDVKNTINKVLGAHEDEDGVMSAEFKTFIIQ